MKSANVGTIEGLSIKASEFRTNYNKALKDLEKAEVGTKEQRKAGREVEMYGTLLTETLNDLKAAHSKLVQVD